MTTSRYWLIVSRIVEAQNPADTLDHSRIRQLGLVRRTRFGSALQIATAWMSNAIPIAAEASRKNSSIWIIPPAPIVASSTATTKARHTNSRMPSARTMPTLKRAIWLETAIKELATRNSPVAVIKDCFSPNMRAPHTLMATANAIGTVQTIESEKSREPLARSGLAATVYWLRDRRTNISWPRTATIPPIWQTLSHMDRCPKSTNESARAASKNIANETTAPTTCSTIAPTRPCVTSRPRNRVAMFSIAL